MAGANSTLKVGATAAPRIFLQVTPLMLMLMLVLVLVIERFQSRIQGGVRLTVYRKRFLTVPRPAVLP